MAILISSYLHTILQETTSFPPPPRPVWQARPQIDSEPLHNCTDTHTTERHGDSQVKRPFAVQTLTIKQASHQHHHSCKT